MQTDYIGTPLIQAKGFDLASLSWLTDISSQQTENDRISYGVPDPCFSGYLGSLGLRYNDGTPKPALDWLTARAANR